MAKQQNTVHLGRMAVYSYAQVTTTQQKSPRCQCGHNKARACICPNKSPEEPGLHFLCSAPGRFRESKSAAYRLLIAQSRRPGLPGIRGSYSYISTGQHLLLSCACELPGTTLMRRRPLLPVDSSCNETQEQLR